MSAPAVVDDRAEELLAEIFAAALAVFLGCRRLDMRALAGDLGISRATMYSKTGWRDQRLGEVLWSLTRRAIEAELRASDDLSGVERVVVKGRFGSGFVAMGGAGVEPATSCL